MGVNNAELYNNIGLCCFYAQQYDMTFNCFMRALAVATDDSLSDVWYNIGHVALVFVHCFVNVSAWCRLGLRQKQTGNGSKPSNFDLEKNTKERLEVQSNKYVCCGSTKNDASETQMVGHMLRNEVLL